jgi:hypothetical protein
VGEKLRATDSKANARRKEHVIPDGTRVMILDPRRVSKKEPRWVGPYTGMERTKGGPYTLMDSTQVLLSRKVPRDQIKVIDPSAFPPEGDAYYEVECVLDHKGKTGEYEYLVKWKSYDDDHNSWVAWKDFEDTQMISKYWNLRGKKQQDEGIECQRIGEETNLEADNADTPRKEGPEPGTDLESGEEKLESVVAVEQAGQDGYVPEGFDIPNCILEQKTTERHGRRTKKVKIQWQAESGMTPICTWEPAAHFPRARFEWLWDEWRLRKMAKESITPAAPAKGKVKRMRRRTPSKIAALQL